MGDFFHGRARRGALAGLATLSLAGAAALGLVAPASAASHPANPYNPATGHSYRHGVIPTITRNAKMKQWAAANAAPAATSANTLSYGGGTGGVGVNDGHAQVYLVFYGTQWGTQSTNGAGDATFSGDPDGAAPVAQEMFKDIGTGGELWSAELTQWCDGNGVATGATSCPSTGASYIPYQSGGVLSGVWYDNSGSSPSAASGNQLGQEAVKAAAHFGNTTASSNRHTYYVILSPHGTNPDNYQGQYCAWHDYTGDSSLTGGAVSSPYGNLAFSNQPYNMDSGSGCGVGFVNSPGTLDGWTMTLGHEWHEMMSDQFPAGGWTNASSGQENSDECAWISPGQAGGAANITMGTGTFAEQASWSNDTNSCAISHPIVNHGGNTVTVSNPGNQTGTVGTAASLQISATDSGGASLTYSATGLPAGLSISSSGLISGTPTTAGTFNVTVTAKDSTGASGSTSFTWTVGSSGGGGGGCTSTGQKLGNPGFETGSAAPWTSTSGVINGNGAGETAHSGSYYAWLDGYGTTHTDTLAQSVAIPAGCSASFGFYLHIDTSETTTSTAYDTLKVQVLSSSGSVLGTLATYSNLNAASGYQLHTFDLSKYAGQTVTLKFTGSEDASLQTSFVVDDTSLKAS